MPLLQVEISSSVETCHNGDDFDDDDGDDGDDNDDNDNNKKTERMTTTTMTKYLARILINTCF